jgi:hypothetical protein
MPAPNLSTDTTFQLQTRTTPGSGLFANLGPVQASYDAALALAVTMTNQPVQIVGVQTGQVVNVISRGNG